MSYNSSLKTMDEHTILFLRPNRIGLAYSWDYYNSCPQVYDLVNADFLNDPPSQIIYKAGYHLFEDKETGLKLRYGRYLRGIYLCENEDDEEFFRPVENSYYYMWIHKAGGIYYAGSTENGLMYSRDGRTWDMCHGVTGKVNTIYYDDVTERWYCGSGEGNGGNTASGIWFSVNGVDWESTDKTDGYVFTLLRKNGVLVAKISTLGDNACKLYVSQSGEDWKVIDVFHSVVDGNPNLTLDMGFDADIYDDTTVVSGWVDFQQACKDGVLKIGEHYKYGRKITNSAEACVVSFINNNRLVNDPDGENDPASLNYNMVIPSTVYIDKDGYEYTIGPNDGNVEYANCVARFGGGDKAHVTISQFDIANPGYKFDKRHLMPDIKLTFNSDESPESAIVTLNSIPVSTFYDAATPNSLYIPNGKDMCNYNDNDFVNESYRFPSNPLIHPYLMSGNLDGFANFLDTNGYLYKITTDKLYRTSFPKIYNSYIQVTTPMLMQYMLDDGSVDTPAQLKEQYGYGKLVVIPIYNAETSSLFAVDIDPRCPTNIVPDLSKFLQYSISTDNGVTWNSYWFEDIDIGVTSVKPVKGAITNGVVVQTNKGFYHTVNGTNWTLLNADTPTEDVSSLSIEKYIEHIYVEQSALNPEMDKNVFVTSDDVVLGRESDDKFINLGFKKSRIMDTLITDLKARLGDSNLEITLNAVMLYYDFPNDQLLGITCGEYSTISGSESPSGFSAVFRINKRVVANLDEEVVLNSLDISTKPISVAVEESPNFTSYYDENYYGSHYVKFNQNEIIRCHNGTWMIRNISDDLDRTDGDTSRGLSSFEVSDDLIVWRRCLLETPILFEDTVQMLTAVEGTSIILIDNDGNDIKVFNYNVPKQAKYHYDMRVKTYQWRGVKLSQQVKASYIIDGISNSQDTHKASTENQPLKVGFPHKINPNAFILFYNGIPLLNTDCYVNPNNPYEVFLPHMQTYRILQTYVNPIQFIRAERDYVYSDFTVMTAEAENDEQDVYIFKDKAKIMNYIGKELRAQFGSDIYGSAIFLNGVDHDYIIENAREITFPITRFGLHETVYSNTVYDRVGEFNCRSDVDKDVYRIRFALVPKRKK